MQFKLTKLFAFLYLYFLLIFSLTLCGGDSDSTDDDATDATSDSINTEKLIGTPFEGLETGDTLDFNLFTCDDYRTNTIDELPIAVFAAFFTEDEEVIIQEGLDIANTAMGDTFYVLTDEWSNDVRVIYKVDDINDEENAIDYEARGHAGALYFFFNGKDYAERISSDWRVEVTESGTNKYTVAHELGHASGISGHWLIDYDNNTFLPDDLEENSLMSGDYTIPPVMTDYTSMMQTQGQIMLNHLSDSSGEKIGDSCD